MQQTALVAMGLMLAAGVIISVQAPINAALGRAISSPLAAATVSFGVGFLLLLVLTLLIGDGSALGRATGVAPWLLIGGAMGAFYVFAALWSVPILGVLTVTGLVVLGQLLAALLLDHYGAFGLMVQQISPLRLLSAGLIAAGVVLSRL